MIWVRSALFYAALTLHSAVFAGIVLAMPRGAGWRACGRVFRLHAVIACRLCGLICGLRVRVLGIENLPAGACVVAANHQSAFETLVLPAFLPPFAWVLKESLVRVPWFGWALRRADAIAIDRGDRRAALGALVAAGLERLGRGTSVVVFPEGTRFAVGGMGGFQSGAVLLARAAKAPLVPLGHDAGRFWPGGAFRIRPGVVTIRIGRPDPELLDEGVPLREARRRLRAAVGELAGAGETF